MRKRVLVMLALMMCLLVQMVPVSAAEVSSLSDPPKDATLISSFDLKDGSFGTVVDGFATCTYMYDKSCKVVAYDAATGTYYCNALTTVDTVWEDGSVHPFETIIPKGFSTYDEALVSAVESTVGDEMSIPISVGSTVAFVGVSGSFKCQVSQLPNYVFDRSSGTQKPVSEPSFDVEVIEYLKTGETVSGAKLRLKYNLPGYSKFGVLTEEHAKTFYASFLSSGVAVTNPGKSGVVEFVAENILNDTYEFELWTDAGNRYRIQYVIDFIEVTEQTAYTGTYDVPVISIIGVPSDTSTKIKAPLMLTVKSNIPVTLMWNGLNVNSKLATEFDISISENGTYQYVAVSEVGQVATGSVDIVNLEELPGMSSHSLLDAGGHLVQTGMEIDGANEVNQGAGAIVAISSLFILCGVILVCRKVKVSSK